MNERQRQSHRIADAPALEGHVMALQQAASLGQLVSRIIHEINTPLSTIRASAANSAHALQELRRDLHNLPLTPELHTLFWKLVDRAWGSTQHLSTREERKLRRNLCQELETCGVADADEIAETLVEMGVYDNVTDFVPLFTSDRHDDILQAVYNLASLNSGNQGTQQAVERISLLLQTVKRASASGQHIEEKHETNIVEGLEQAIALFRLLKIARSITITTHYDDLPDLLCVPDLLTLVWRLLVQNAIEAIEGETGAITIRAFQHDHGLMIEICDSGHGIPQEMQDHIFDPFFTTKPVHAGAGLGLTLVKHILDLHHGTINFSSTAEATTFSVWLPLE